MKAVKLISSILSLLLARDGSLVIADHAFVRSFHGLRNFRIINIQLVQSMSKRGSVGDRMQRIDRAHRLARVRRPGGRKQW